MAQTPEQAAYWQQLYSASARAAAAPALGGVTVELNPAAIEAWLKSNSEALLGPGAELIASRQAERAPRDPHSSEHMADHIVTDFHDGVADIGPEKRFFYAAFVEHGTEKMVAEPFVRPSVDG